MNKHAHRSLALLLLLFLLISTRTTVADWPQWRGNAQRSGVTDTPVRIDSPGVRWTRATGGTPQEVVARDVDQDGALELLSIEGGRVVARRATGQVVWDSAGVLARRVVGVEDLDSDGVLEVVVDGTTGAVLLDGATGAVVWQSSPTLPIESIGTFGLVDLIGGPAPEIIIADKAGNAGKPNLTGAAFVFSFDDGIGDGEPAVVTEGGTRDYEAGRSITWTDVDGDGALDIVAPGARRLYAYDAMSGQLLYASDDLEMPAGENLSQSVVFGRDADENGADELYLLTSSVFVGTPSRRVAMARVDGGELLWQWTHAAQADPAASHAWPAEPLGDLDGDGAPDLVTSFYAPADGWRTVVLDPATGAVRTELPGQRAAALIPSDLPGRPDLFTESTSFPVPGPFEEKRAYRLAPGAPPTLLATFPSAAVIPSPAGARFEPSAPAELLLMQDSDGDSFGDGVSLVSYPSGQVLRSVTAQGSLLGASSSAFLDKPYLTLLQASGRLSVYDAALALQNDLNGDELADLRYEGHYLYRVAATVTDGQPLLAVPEAGGQLVVLDPTQGTPFAEPPEWLKLHSNMPQLPVFMTLPSGPAVLVLALDESRRQAIRAVGLSGDAAWTAVLGGEGGTYLLKGDPLVFDANADGTDDVVVAVEDLALGQVHRIIAVDGASGALLYTSQDIPTPGGGVGALSASTDGSLIYVVASKTLTVLDAATGDTVGAIPLSAGNHYGTPIPVDLDGDLEDDLLVVGTTTGALAYDPDLSLLWQHPMGGAFRGSGAVAQREDGAVVLLSRSSGPVVDLLYADNGALISTTALAQGTAWPGGTSLPTGASASSIQEILPAHDLLGDGADGFLVASTDGFLYALRSDATLAWSHSVGAGIGSPALVDTDGDGTAEVALPLLSGHLVLLDDTPVQATEWVRENADASQGFDPTDVDEKEDPTRLRVSWAPVDGASSYAVRVVSQFGTVVAQALNTGPDPFAELTGLSLQSGVLYTTSVRALSDANGTTIAGPEASSDGVSVVDLTAPTVSTPKASPFVFSPDITGLLSHTTLTAQLADETRLGFWSVAVKSAGGAIVRDFSGPLSTPVADLEVVWDGLDTEGNKAPSGKYSVEVTAHDVSGHATSATTKVHVLRLPAWASKFHGKGDKHDKDKDKDKEGSSAKKGCSRSKAHAK